MWIGDYVRFGPNVGILSVNHDLYERDKAVGNPIKIGDYCWIGMNALVLAGVELGPSTIVEGKYCNEIISRWLLRDCR